MPEQRCKNHTDDIPCPVKLTQDAADTIRACKNDLEANAVAVEAMRMAARLAD